MWLVLVPRLPFNFLLVFHKPAMKMITLDNVQNYIRFYIFILLLPASTTQPCMVFIRAEYNVDCQPTRENILSLLFVVHIKALARDK